MGAHGRHHHLVVERRRRRAGRARRLARAASSAAWSGARRRRRGSSPARACGRGPAPAAARSAARDRASPRRRSRSTRPAPTARPGRRARCRSASRLRPAGALTQQLEDVLHHVGQLGDRGEAHRRAHALQRVRDAEDLVDGLAVVRVLLELRRPRGSAPGDAPAPRRGTSACTRRCPSRLPVDERMCRRQAERSGSATRSVEPITR